jgi:hypothetical protein
LRYAEKDSVVSLEVVMPQGVDKVLSAEEQDDLSISIVKGLCESITFENKEDGRVAGNFILKA